jgi:small-conductance mechanosensitive channel
LRRREAALEEYKKVQDQLREVLQKLVSERQACADARHKSQELHRRIDHGNKTLKEQVSHTYSQQKQLRYLRAQVKELKEPQSHTSAPSTAESRSFSDTPLVPEPLEAVHSQAVVKPQPARQVMDTSANTAAVSSQADTKVAANGTPASARKGSKTNQSAKELKTSARTIANVSPKQFAHYPSVGAWLRPLPKLLWDPAEHPDFRNPFSSERASQIEAKRPTDARSAADSEDNFSVVTDEE